MKHHLAEEGRDFEATLPDQALVRAGLVMGVDLVHAFLKQRAKQLAADENDGVAKVLFPLEQTLRRRLQKGLEQSLDFFLPCRL